MWCWRSGRGGEHTEGLTPDLGCWEAGVPLAGLAGTQPLPRAGGGARTGTPPGPHCWGGSQPHGLPWLPREGLFGQIKGP